MTPSTALDPSPAVDPNELFTRFFSKLGDIRRLHDQLAQPAAEALNRLASACVHRGGQSYKIRALLYSVWNGGHPVDLSEIMPLDWELRRDLCLVLLAFNCPGCPSYDELQNAFTAVDQFDWFVEAGTSTN